MELLIWIHIRLLIFGFDLQLYKVRTKYMVFIPLFKSHHTPLFKMDVSFIKFQIP